MLPGFAAHGRSQSGSVDGIPTNGVAPRESASTGGAAVNLPVADTVFTHTPSASEAEHTRYPSNEWDRSSVVTRKKAVSEPEKPSAAALGAGSSSRPDAKPRRRRRVRKARTALIDDDGPEAGGGDDHDDGDRRTRGATEGEVPSGASIGIGGGIPAVPGRRRSREGRDPAGRDRRGGSRPSGSHSERIETTAIADVADVAGVIAGDGDGKGEHMANAGVGGGASRVSGASDAPGEASGAPGENGENGDRSNGRAALGAAAKDRVVGRAIRTRSGSDPGSPGLAGLLKLSVNLEPDRLDLEKTDALRKGKGGHHSKLASGTMPSHALGHLYRDLEGKGAGGVSGDGNAVVGGDEKGEGEVGGGGGGGEEDAEPVSKVSRAWGSVMGWVKEKLKDKDTDGASPVISSSSSSSTDNAKSPTTGSAQGGGTGDGGGDGDDGDGDGVGAGDLDGEGDGIGDGDTLNASSVARAGAGTAPERTLSDVMMLTAHRAKLLQAESQVGAAVVAPAGAAGAGFRDWGVSPASKATVAEEPAMARRSLTSQPSDSGSEASAQSGGFRNWGFSPASTTAVKKVDEGGDDKTADTAVLEVVADARDAKGANAPKGVKGVAGAVGAAVGAAVMAGATGVAAAAGAMGAAVDAAAASRSTGADTGSEEGAGVGNSAGVGLGVGAGAGVGSGVVNVQLVVKIESLEGQLAAATAEVVRLRGVDYVNVHGSPVAGGARKESETENSRSQLKVAALQAEIATRSVGLAEAHDEISDLKCTLEAAKIREKELTTRYRDLTEASSSGLEEVEAARTKLREVEGERMRFRDMALRFNGQEAKLREATSTISDMQSKVRASDREIERLRADVSRMAEAADRSDNAHADRKARIRAAQEEELQRVEERSEQFWKAALAASLAECKLTHAAELKAQLTEERRKTAEIRMQCLSSPSMRLAAAQLATGQVEAHDEALAAARRSTSEDVAHTAQDLEAHTGSTEWGARRAGSLPGSRASQGDGAGLGGGNGVVGASNRQAVSAGLDGPVVGEEGEGKGIKEIQDDDGKDIRGIGSGLHSEMNGGGAPSLLQSSAGGGVQGFGGHGGQSFGVTSLPFIGADSSSKADGSFVALDGALRSIEAYMGTTCIPDREGQVRGYARECDMFELQSKENRSLLRGVVVDTLSLQNRQRRVCTWSIFSLLLPSRILLSQSYSPPSNRVFPNPLISASTSKSSQTTGKRRSWRRRWATKFATSVFLSMASALKTPLNIAQRRSDSRRPCASAALSKCMGSCAPSAGNRSRGRCR